MKKVLFLLFVVFTNSSIHAQTEKDSNQNTEGSAKKNIVKLNFPALAFKNFTVQYERAIAKKITLAGTFRLMPKGSIPFKSAFIKAANDPDVERQINNLKVGNMAFMPELRFYLGKRGAFHGFYLAPFANIAKYDADLIFEYDDNVTTKTIPLSGSVNSLTGGLMMGAQWKLSKSLYLDWWILGANYGNSKGDITGKKTLNTSEQQSLRDELASLDIPLTNFTYIVDGNGATLNFKGPWGGIRAGICLGINF
ncbi:MAG: DUF3575 domain-containing protein [Ferruginibacter sp.]